MRKWFLASLYKCMKLLIKNVLYNMYKYHMINKTPMQNSIEACESYTIPIKHDSHFKKFRL